MRTLKPLKIRDKYPCVLCFVLFPDLSTLGKHYADMHAECDLMKLGMHPEILKSPIRSSEKGYSYSDMRSIVSVTDFPPNEGLPLQDQDDSDEEPLNLNID